MEDHTSGAPPEDRASAILAEGAAEFLVKERPCASLFENIEGADEQLRKMQGVAAKIENAEARERLESHIGDQIGNLRKVHDSMNDLNVALGGKRRAPLPPIGQRQAAA